MRKWKGRKVLVAIALSKIRLVNLAETQIMEVWCLQSGCLFKVNILANASTATTTIETKGLHRVTAENEMFVQSKAVNLFSGINSF